MTTEFTKTESTLLENYEKETEKHPDFRGEMTLFGNRYKAAAWLKNNKKGQPCIGLSLKSKDDDVQNLDVTLWQKEKRASSSEPHFRTKQDFLGEPLVFSGWVTFEEERGALRIEITRGGDEVTQAAKDNRKKLAAFLKEADGVDPVLTHRTAAKGSGLSASAVVGNDPDSEPEDIPFATRIYKDVRQSRLNRTVF